MHTAAYNG